MKLVESFFNAEKSNKLVINKYFYIDILKNNKELKLFTKYSKNYQLYLVYLIFLFNHFCYQKKRYLNYKILFKNKNIIRKVIKNSKVDEIFTFTYKI